jgi:TP53 regulating kinase-like protein
MQNQKILAQGAEAIISQEDNQIIKQRVIKDYRIPEIDEKIRKLRTRQEAKLLEKASHFIPVPKVIKSDEKTKEIIMELIDGKKLSTNLDSLSEKEQISICKQIGQNIAKLHNESIIHGDLTTSNMILKDKKVYFIDFGLGYISIKDEDKAVDLHLLKQALEAKHFQHWQKLWLAVEKGYIDSNKQANKILERLKKVESRGRYKDKY